MDAKRKTKKESTPKVAPPAVEEKVEEPEVLKQAREKKALAAKKLKEREAEIKEAHAKFEASQKDDKEEEVPEDVGPLISFDRYFRKLLELGRVKERWYQGMKVFTDTSVPRTFDGWEKIFAVY